MKETPLNILLDMLPENISLYRDSSVWRIVADDNETVLCWQESEECFRDFIIRFLEPVDTSGYVPTLKECYRSDEIGKARSERIANLKAENERLRNFISKDLQGLLAELKDKSVLLLGSNALRSAGNAYKTTADDLDELIKKIEKELEK